MSKKNPYSPTSIATRTKKEMIEGRKVSRSWGPRGSRTRLAKQKYPHATDRDLKAPLPEITEHYTSSIPVDPVSGARLPKQVLAARDKANSYFDPVIIPRWKALELGLHGVTYVS